MEEKNLKKIKKNADIILASNVFAHSDKLKEMAICMLKLLKEKGTLIIKLLETILGKKSTEFMIKNRLPYCEVKFKFAPTDADKFT